VSVTSVLVVDDDATIRETLADFFAASGLMVRQAASAGDARAALAQSLPDVVILDLHLPDAHGLSLLDQLRDADPDGAIVVLTGHADVATAVRVMQLGAFDLLEKPVALDRVLQSVQDGASRARVRRELALTPQPLATATGGATRTVLQPSFDKLIELAARNDDAPVLILGETGVGKGVVARRIHDRSPRASHPFVEINCASLSTTFFESEVFGHERGAFTDARTSKRGLLEVAATGTLFLDEIGELDLAVQPRLLKVIDEQRFRRLGGTLELRTNSRLVCATNRPLAALVEKETFRADLFYRLQVLTITVPPLRERRDELPALVAQCLPRGAALSGDAERAIARYPWPGNVRELKNALWRAAIIADGRPITVDDLGLGSAVSTAASPVEPEGETLAALERRAIERALHDTDGNRSLAARRLGIARSTLHEKLRQLYNP
jgi:DNA-binding NtrC family response regulator